MRMLLLCLLITATFLVSRPALHAQSNLREELKDTDIAPHWIYDDLPAALARARETGKPILVVLRCVPCPPGRTLDAQVMRPDKELEKLEQQFVCVRVIQTRGLDLQLFQYDYDQSWTALFLNADKVIYGRYGTRASSGAQSDAYLSLASFRKAMERALELHRNYPANKEQLAGKIGPKPDYAVPEQIPGLEERAQGPTTRKTCIHCHMVREYHLRAKWQENRLSAADLRVYPLPDRIGLKMDIEDGLLIKEVAADSPAAKAGLVARDELMALNGQPLTSLADIQWVLHNAPTEGRLQAKVRRKGQELEKTIAVSGSWKESDISWRASSWYGLRQGLKVDPLPPEEKKKHGLAADALALQVNGLFGRGGPLLQKAGLRKGDIIVAVDGKSTAMNETQFLVDLRLQHGPKDSVRMTVLRGEQRQELTIPMW